MDDRVRCAWALIDPLLLEYHDREWGDPIDNDDKYFERLMLEIFQAGLNWRMILAKRPALRRAFDNFFIPRVAAYGERDVERLMGDPSIIRNRLKINAAIHNAQVFLQLQESHDSFHNYLSSLDNDLDVLRKEFKRRFFFTGPKIIESFLESVGKLPVPHEPGCFKSRPLTKT